MLLKFIYYFRLFVITVNAIIHTSFFIHEMKESDEYDYIFENNILPIIMISTILVISFILFIISIRSNIGIKRVQFTV